MLHQFLPAETIQVPEESVLFIFPGVLFLSHGCKVLDSPSYVNTNSKFLVPASLLTAIGDAEALADRHDGVLKIR
jgi:hypothetical protein